MPVAATTFIDRRGIRDLALKITGTIWVIGFCVAMYFDEPAPRAVVLSGMQALGGLGAWWCYHLISRRNDGMVIIMTALNLALRTHPERPLSSEMKFRVLFFLFAIAFAAAIAYFVRPRAEKTPKPATAPLWDAEIDQAAHAPRVEPHPGFNYDVRS